MLRSVSPGPWANVELGPGRSFILAGTSLFRSFGTGSNLRGPDSFGD